MQKVSHTIQTNRKTTVPLYWPLRVLFSDFKTPAAQRLPLSAGWSLGSTVVRDYCRFLISGCSVVSRKNAARRFACARS